MYLQGINHLDKNYKWLNLEYMLRMDDNTMRTLRYTDDILLCMSSMSLDYRRHLIVTCMYRVVS